MKKSIVVICLVLTALPILANGVGEVGTECTSMAGDARREVVESEVPANAETPAETHTTVR